MTSEHTDTAKIRAEHTYTDYPGHGTETVCDDCGQYAPCEANRLADALDAAWAVIADQTRDVAIRLSVRDERERDLKARAEAAEAELAEEARNHLDDIRLLQAAEARITAALDQKCRQPHAEGCCGCPVHAALAGGTA